MAGGGVCLWLGDLQGFCGLMFSPITYKIGGGKDFLKTMIKKGICSEKEKKKC